MLSSLNLVCKRLPQTAVVFPSSCCNRWVHCSAANRAARKGTREKARKKKVKVEEKKVGFIPHNLRGLDKLNLVRVSKHTDDSWKAVSADNVWVAKYYQWRMYTVAEAVEAHRETHHPTMYNRPEAPLTAFVELNMQAEKQTRFVEKFTRMAMIPHSFDHNEERSIVVFSKDQASLQMASEAGATLVGGPELIKDIQNGDLSVNDFQYVIAHPNILAELVGVRGLMRRKFPNPKAGTLGTDLADMVRKFTTGIRYDAVKDEHQPDYGFVETNIGTINMEPTHLEANLSALLQDINMMRPKRDGKFITRCVLKCAPSSERLKVNPFLYVESETKLRTSKPNQDELLNEASDDEEELKRKVGASI